MCQGGHESRLADIRKPNQHGSTRTFFFNVENGFMPARLFAFLTTGFQLGEPPAVIRAQFIRALVFGNGREKILQVGDFLIG
jgi:hypothetical protein